MKQFLSIITMLFISTALVAQQQHVVMMEGGSFNPSSITIMEGDVVMWTNNSTDVHTSTSGTGCANDGTWNSGDVAPGGSFQYTFTTAGNYDYFCIPHCGMGMTGMVVVQSSSSINETGNELMFSLYPNPSQSILNVNFGSVNMSKAAISISDVTGKTMLAPQNNILLPGQNTLQVDIATLPKGTYILRLSTNEGVKSEVFYKL